MISLINKSSKESFDEDGIYTFLNPYSYLKLRKHKDVLSAFSGIGIDGISLCILLRLFGVSYVNRTSFDMTSVANSEFQRCIDFSKSVYLIGSEESQIALSIKNIQDRFPMLNVIGFRSGYFKNEIDRDLELAKIIELKPDVVIVGMGVLLQEHFLKDLKNKGWIGRGFSCGGFLHQTAKSVNYYPELFNTLNLRWLYRIFDEPKLLLRYMLEYPKFCMIFFADVLSWRIQKLIGH